MTNNRRLLELALKGLEAERQRIDDEMSDIHRQLGGQATAAAASRGRPQSAAQGRGQTGSNLTPAGRRKLSELMRRRWAAKRKAGSTGSQTGQAAKKQQTTGNLTPAGRKKLSDLMRRRWAAKRKAGAR
jgi:hypothetical protein